MNNKQWFKDAGFGMMIHFGLYSMLAGEYNGKRTDFVAEWAQSYFRIPNKEYERLAAAFNPIYFNADDWIKTALDAGMKYFVFTSKHHDGFAMYHSKVDKFNIVDATPFKRDITAEIAKSCYKHGMKLGLYYSHALDWHEEHGGGYNHPEWSEKYGLDGDPDKNFGNSWCNDWDFPNNRAKNFDICFKKKIKPQVKEILTQYGELCLIWFDCPFSISIEQKAELCRMVRKYQPNCLIGSRIGEMAGTGCNYDYSSVGDNVIPDSFTDKNFLCESPTTLNDTWGYSASDQNWKSPEKVIEIKKHLNERGINYLLNIGPDGLGRFPAKSLEILSEVGKNIL